MDNGERTSQAVPMEYKTPEGAEQKGLQAVRMRPNGRSFHRRGVSRRSAILRTAGAVGSIIGLELGAAAIVAPFSGSKEPLPANPRPEPVSEKPVNNPSTEQKAEPNFLQRLFNQPTNQQEEQNKRAEEMRRQFETQRGVPHKSNAEIMEELKQEQLQKAEEARKNGI